MQSARGVMLQDTNSISPHFHLARVQDQRSLNSTCGNNYTQMRRVAVTTLIKTCGGQAPYTPSKYHFIPRACGPGTPAIYPQTHFHRHSNGVLVAERHFHK